MKRYFNLMLAGLVLVLGLLALFVISTSPAEAKTITVDDDGEGDYETIQDALDSADEGDEIRVWDGTYQENVLVNKTLSLVGNGSTTTTVDARGSGSTFKVTEDWVNITGFSIRGGGEDYVDSGIEVRASYTTIRDNNCSGNNESGIMLYTSSHNLVSNNSCWENDRGIHVYNGGDNNTLENNRCFNNDRTGIDFGKTWDSIIANNTISGNGEDGLSVSTPRRCRFINNTITYHPYEGLEVSGVNNVYKDNTMSGCGFIMRASNREWANSYSIDKTNTVNGKSVYYYKNESGISVASDVGQVLLANCTDIRIEGESYENGGVGLLLNFCSNITIDNCSFRNNSHGIYLYQSTYNNITRNRVQGSRSKAIYLGYSCDYNIISGNSCSGPEGEGIVFSQADHNLVHNNSCSGFEFYGMDLHGRSNTIEGNHFSGNEKAGIFIQQGSSRYNLLSSNHFSKNRYGVYLWIARNTTLSYNTITENEIGIYLNRSALGNVAHFNNLLSNTEYGISAADNSGNGINATNNWWGDASGPYHSESNKDGTGDNTTDDVEFDPWLAYDPLTAIIVDDDAPDGGNGSKEKPYNTIQEAIDAADEGDTIAVWAGSYEENVLVNKTLNLVGNGSEFVTIDGGGVGDVVKITAEWVNMSGLGVTNSEVLDGAGIRAARYNRIFNNHCSNTHYGIKAASDCRIDSNTCENNVYGIYLSNANDGEVMNNTCYSNSDSGIALINSDYNTINNNTCYLNTQNGIHLFSSSGRNTLMNNSCYSNDLDGIRFHKSGGSTVENNICYSNSRYGIVLFILSRHSTINNNICSGNGNTGIFLDTSTDCIIENNTCSENSNTGIFLTDSSYDCTINNNTCENNFYGIYLEKSSDWCTINNNTCSENSHAGIFLDTIDCTIENNKMTGNGIYLFGEHEHWDTHTIETSNTVDEKPVYYYKNARDLRVPGGAGQVILANCREIVVENQNCSSGTVGILIGYSSHITLNDNECSENNVAGVFLFQSSDCAIINNTCLNNDAGISLEESLDCKIRNNTCSENNNQGIYLESSRGSTTNNTCLNNRYGIHFYYSNNSGIRNNTCHSNMVSGIYLDSSSNCTINNNTCYSNTGSGIHLDHHSHNCTINNNTCYSNTGSGISSSSSRNSMISNNKCYSNIDSGIFLSYHSSSSTISNNTCYSNKGSGIFLYYYSSFSTISNNTCYSNMDPGISLYSSRDSMITNNMVSKNNIGIYLNSSQNNTVHNNDIYNSSDHGISLLFSGDSTISNNTISENGVGIYLNSSQKNAAHYNAIYNNSDYGIDANENNDYTMDATRNWWGHGTGPYHDPENPDGEGDPVSNYVDFESWFRKPIPTDYTSPRAVIDTVVPDYALEGMEFAFTGHGSFYGSVDHFLWSSDLDSELHSSTTEPDFNISSLSNGTHTIIFRAQDNYGVWSEPTTTTITVNGRPRVRIIDISPHPATDSEPVQFQGKASDDGTVVRYVWRNGTEEIYIGSSEKFSYDDLDIGEHTIYLKVLDDLGAWSEEVSGTLIIHQRPTAVIKTPVQNSSAPGENISFMAQGMDDGDITRYLWRSSLNGVLYNGSEDSFMCNNLSLGNHIIYLKVQDNHGAWSEEVNRTLIIHQRPKAKMGTYIYSDPFDSEWKYLWNPGPYSEGSDQLLYGGGVDDGEIILYNWSSSIDGFLYNGSETKISLSILSPGNHTISLMVMDNHGAWSETISQGLFIEKSPDLVFSQVDVRQIVQHDHMEFEISYQVENTVPGTGPLEDVDILVYREDKYGDSNTIGVIWIGDLGAEPDNQISGSITTGWTPKPTTPKDMAVFHLKLKLNPNAIISEGNRTNNDVTFCILPSTVLKEGNSILLSAQALTQGREGANRFSWVSSLDGEIYNGTGSEWLWSAALISPGEHEITLRAWSDSGSFSRTLNATLIVNQRPVVQGVNLSQTKVEVGDTMTFQALVEDDSNIVLYSWRSNLDGNIYNGSEAEFSYSNLSAGEHMFIVRVMDEHGRWSPFVLQNDTVLTVEEPEEEDKKSFPVIISLLIFGVGGLLAFIYLRSPALDQKGGLSPGKEASQDQGSESTKFLTCPKCKEQISSKFPYCVECGINLKQETDKSEESKP